MFELNSIDGKIKRLEDITRLIRVGSEIPGRYLSFTDAHTVTQYLLECKRDIEDQLRGL